jgi:hypothetical protein
MGLSLDDVMRRFLWRIAVPAVIVLMRHIRPSAMAPAQRVRVAGRSAGRSEGGGDRDHEPVGSVGGS